MTENYNPYLRGKATKNGDKYTGGSYVEDNQTWFFIVPKEHENEADPYLYETREEPADFELISKLGEAYDAGAAAFKAGKMRVPALDPNTLNRLMPGAKDGEAIKILDAWILGWDHSNISAPWEGFDFGGGIDDPKY